MGPLPGLFVALVYAEMKLGVMQARYYALEGGM